MATEPADSEEKLSRKQLWMRILLILAIVAAVFFVLQFVDIQGMLESFILWLEGLGPWAPVLFFILYSATVGFLPVMIWMSGAGFLFGLVGGTLLAWIGFLVASTYMFLASRYLFREKVEAKFGGRQEFTAFNQAVNESGWRFVSLIRFSPISSVFVNLSLGLMKISYPVYLLATALSMVLVSFMYVYIGNLTRKVAEKSAEDASDWLTTTLFAITAILMVWATLYAINMVKRVMKEVSEKKETS